MESNEYESPPSLYIDLDVAYNVVSIAMCILQFEIDKTFIKLEFGFLRVVWMCHFHFQFHFQFVMCGFYFVK